MQCLVASIVLCIFLAVAALWVSGRRDGRQLASRGRGCAVFTRVAGISLLTAVEAESLDKFTVVKRKRLLKICKFSIA